MNNTSITQPLHYPGALTDEQWARFAGRGESTNCVIYDWHRTTETGTAKTITIGTFETPTCDILAILHEQAQARNPERTDWTPSPAYKPAIGRGLSRAQIDFERAGQEWKVTR